MKGGGEVVLDRLYKDLSQDGKTVREGNWRQTAVV